MKIVEVVADTDILQELQAAEASAKSIMLTVSAVVRGIGATRVPEVKTNSRKDPSVARLYFRMKDNKRCNANTRKELETRISAKLKEKGYNVRFKVNCTGGTDFSVFVTVPKATGGQRKTYSTQSARPKRLKPKSK